MIRTFRILRRKLTREIGSLLVDTGNVLLGNRYRLTPPTRMAYSGGGDYRAAGFKLFHFLVHMGGLRPSDRVLDMGCGIGRVARPLTGYLEGGSYVGIDVVEKGITWCSGNITPRFPHFRFMHADVRNHMYNPAGSSPAESYRFPLEDDSFDYVIFASVFTHMRPGALRHYLTEAARVLKSGGGLFTTWFLLNDESRRLMQNGSARFRFGIPFDSEAACFIADPHLPEAAVAYGEKETLAFLDGLGFKPLGPIQYGNWCGRINFNHLQDLLMLRFET